MSIRLRALSALFICLVPLASMAGPDTPATKKDILVEAWDRTRLTFDFFQTSFLSHCTENVNYFLGCVEALSALGGQLDPPQSLGTRRSVAKLNPLFTRVIRTYPNGIVLYSSSSPLEADEQIANLKSIKESELVKFKNLEEIFTQVSAPRKFHNELFQELKSQLSPATIKRFGEAQITGSLINRWLAQAGDAHTYIEPRSYVYRNSSAERNAYTGIGITFGENPDGSVFIKDVTKNQPAMEAGIRRLSIIKELNGESMKGKSLDEVRAAFAAHPEPELSLGLSIDGKTKTYNVTRRSIQTPNIEDEIRWVDNKRYGILRIRSFSDSGVNREAKEALTRLMTNGAQGIVLDLRGNGGGSTNEAIKIAGFFLGQKKIVSFVNPITGELIEDHYGPDRAICDLPLVVVQDHGSASASEVVAGSLKDHRRAWIVGEPSYGKGSAQEELFEPRTTFERVLHRKSPEITIFSTIARFEMPKGGSTQWHGVFPDLQITEDIVRDELAEMKKTRERDHHRLIPPSHDFPSNRSRESLKLMEQCFEKVRLNDCEYAMIQRGAQFQAPDYRLLNALAVLSCL